LQSVREKKGPAYLLYITQGKIESLKDYMLLFNKEKLIVESPHEQVVLSSLMHGIKAEGPLMAKLARKPMLGTLRHFMNKVEEFINQEETVAAMMKSKVEVDKVVPGIVKVESRISVGKKKKDKKNVKNS
jgi:hypothetical protein